jgi:hypothetical protein
MHILAQILEVTTYEARQDGAGSSPAPSIHAFTYEKNTFATSTQKI